MASSSSTSPSSTAELFTNRIKSLSQIRDLCFPALIRARQIAGFTQLSFPESFLKPEEGRFLSFYNSGPISSESPLFLELNRLISSLNEYHHLDPSLAEVRQSYQDYIQSVCITSSEKTRWKLLKGDVRLIVRIQGELACLKIPRNLAKKMVFCEELTPLFQIDQTSFRSGSLSPGIEEAIYQLEAHLSETTPPSSLLLKIENLFIKSNNESRISRILQISNSPSGCLLKTVLNPELPERLADRLKTEISRSSFTREFLLSLLTLPQNGSSDQFQISLSKDGERAIQAISYRELSPHLSQEEPTKCRSILFLLDSLMSLPIETHYRKNIEKTDIDLLLIKWISRTIEYNQSNAKIQEELFLKKSDLDSLSLPVTLSHLTLNYIHRALERIQEQVRQSDERLTHWDLLEKLHPSLYQTYRALVSQYPDRPLDAEEKLFSDSPALQNSYLLPPLDHALQSWLALVFPTIEATRQEKILGELLSSLPNLSHLRLSHLKLAGVNLSRLLQRAPHLQELTLLSNKFLSKDDFISLFEENSHIAFTIEATNQLTSHELAELIKLTQNRNILFSLLIEDKKYRPLETKLLKQALFYDLTNLLEALLICEVKIDSPELLQTIVREGSPRMLRQIHSLIPSLNLQIEGETLLHAAARASRADLIPLLCEIDRMQINMADTAGQTPLHIAARYGSAQVAQLLLERGADPFLTDHNLETPFDLAIRYKSDEVGYLLISSPSPLLLDQRDSDDSDSDNDLIPLPAGRILSEAGHRAMKRYRREVSSFILTDLSETVSTKTVDHNKTLNGLFTLEKISAYHFEKKDYRSALLFLGKALSIARNHPNTAPSYLPLLELRFSRVENRFLYEKIGITATNPSPNPIGYYRSRLETVRSSVRNAIQDQLPIEQVQSILSQGYRAILTSLFQESINLLGAQPSKYALIALDGFSREEVFPSSGLKMALIVEKSDSLYFFERLCELLEIKIIQLGESPCDTPLESSLQYCGFFFDRTSFAIGTVEEVAKALLLSPHNSLIIGDKTLFARYKAVVSQLSHKREGALFGLIGGKPFHKAQAISSLKNYREQWRRVQERVRSTSEESLHLESDLYRPLKAALSSLLLYFDKGNLTIRRGIVQLPFNAQSKRVLLITFNHTSSLIMNAQLKRFEDQESSIRRKDKIAIYRVLDPLYQAISNFTDEQNVKHLQSAKLTFSTQIRNNEKEATTLFLEALKNNDIKLQISCLREISIFCIERADYRLATSLLNTAYALTEDGPLFAEERGLLLGEMGEIEKALIQRETSQRVVYHNKINAYRLQLEQIRSELTAFIASKETISRITPIPAHWGRPHLGLFSRNKLIAEEARRDLAEDLATSCRAVVFEEATKHVSKALQTLCNSYKNLLQQLLEDCIQMVASPPPTSFAMAGLGSMSRDEICPYSDIEFIFLIEDDSERARSYFRLISKLLALKIINLGETKAELIPTKKGRKSLTPKGFSIDIGGLFPIEGLYELIGTPEELAQFQRESWLRKNDSQMPLVNAMRSVCLITGEHRLITAYQNEVERILNERVDSLPSSSPSSSSSSSSQFTGRPLREVRALELMEGIDLFRPRLNKATIDQRSFKVKEGLYRLPQMVVSSLALYYGLRSSNTIEQITQLQERGIFSKKGADKLKSTIQHILLIRIKTHLFYKAENEELYFSRGEDDEEAKGLLTMTPELTHEIAEIHKTLMPLYAKAKAFREGELRAFANEPFYDETVGSTDHSKIDRLQFKAQMDSGTIAVALNPNNALAHQYLARTHQTVGKAKKAARHFEESLSLLKRKYNDRPHPDLAAAFHSLGQAYLNLDRYSEGISHCNSALAIYQQLYQEQPHPDIASVFTTLGSAYSLLSDYDEAIKYHNISLDIFKKIFPNKSNPNILNCLINLGNIYFALGDYQQALDRLNFCLEESKKIHGDGPHRETAQLLVMIANVYSSLHEYSKGIELYKSAKTLYEQIYGERSHPDVARLLTNLGKAHQDMGDYPQALNFLDDSLKRLKKLHNNRPHSEIALTLSNLAAVYGSLDNYDQAAAYLEESLAILNKIYNKPHEDIVIASNLLGLAYSKLNRRDEAIKLLESSLLIARQIHKGPHHRIASILLNLGTAYMGKSDSQAVDCFQECLSIESQIHDDRPTPAKSRALNNLALIYSNLGSHGLAIDHYNSSLAMKRAIYGDRAQSDIASSLMALGMTYLDLKKFKNAIDHFKSGIAMYRQIHDNQPSSIFAHSLTVLAGAYEQLGESLSALEREASHPENKLPLIEEVSSEAGRRWSEPGRLISPAISSSSAFTTSNSDLSDSAPSTPQKSASKFAKAIKNYTFALEIYRELYKEKPNFKVATTLENLASICQKLANFEKAIDYSEAALAIYKQIGDKQSNRRAVALLNKISTNYLNLKRLDQAEHCLNLALTISKELDDHQTSLLTMANLIGLGHFYRDLGKLQKAVEFYKASYKAYQSIERQSDREKGAFVMAQVLHNLGALYNVSNDPLTAIQYFSLCITLKKQVNNGEPDPELVLTLGAMGSAYSEVGNHQAAISSLNEALEILEFKYKDQANKEKANILMRLGNTYNDLKDFKRGVDYLSSALSVYRELYGDQFYEDRDVALDIATIFMSLGYATPLEEAAPHYESSLEIKRRVYGDYPHPDIVSTLCNLALCYKKNNPSKSIEYYTSALHLSQKLYSNRPHPTTAKILTDLGHIYKALGELEKAIESLDASLAIQKQLYGEQPHQNIIMLLDELRIICEESNNSQKTVHYSELLLALFEKKYRSNSHPACLTLLIKLGALHIDLKEYLKAIEYFSRHLIAIQETSDPSSQIYKSLDLFYLGELYLQTKDFQRSIEHYNLFLITSKGIDDKKIQEMTVGAFINLSHLHIKLDDFHRGLDLCNTALSMIQKIREGSSFRERRAILLSNSGDCYTGLRDFSRAIEHYNSALSEYKAINAEQAYLAEALKGLGNAYKGLNQFERALNYYQESFQSYLQAVGPEHTDTKEVEEKIRELRNQS